MTQNRPPAKKFVQPKAAPVGLLPTPGMAVRLKGQPDMDPGRVRESDAWWDTLLLRGVDISDQVLVDWTVTPGAPLVRWERTSQLEQVVTTPAEDDTPAK